LQLSFFGIVAGPETGARPSRCTTAVGGGRKRKGARKLAGAKHLLAGSRPVSAPKRARIDPELERIFGGRRSSGNFEPEEITKDEDDAEDASMSDEELDMEAR
jgi:hypothetical protein